MVVLNNRGSGGRLPPTTMEGDPDFGDPDDWSRWEAELGFSELDVLTAVVGHPGSVGASQDEISEAYMGKMSLPDLKGSFNRRFRQVNPLDSIVFLDDYRPEQSIFNFPPPAA